MTTTHIQHHAFARWGCAYHATAEAFQDTGRVAHLTLVYYLCRKCEKLLHFLSFPPGHQSTDALMTVQLDAAVFRSAADRAGVSSFGRKVRGRGVGGTRHFVKPI